MRVALAVAAVVLLAGCGGHKATATKRFVALPVPRYPGASAPKVVENPTYETTDFTLDPRAKAAAVYDWYAKNLPSRGWKITQRNETGLHAEKGKRTLDIGVRGTTLEINQG